MKCHSRMGSQWGRGIDSSPLLKSCTFSQWLSRGLSPAHSKCFMMKNNIKYEYQINATVLIFLKDKIFFFKKGGRCK